MPLTGDPRQGRLTANIFVRAIEGARMSKTMMMLAARAAFATAILITNARRWHWAAVLTIMVLTFVRLNTQVVR